MHPTTRAPEQENTGQVLTPKIPREEENERGKGEGGEADWNLMRSIESFTLI